MIEDICLTSTKCQLMFGGVDFGLLSSDLLELKQLHEICIIFCHLTRLFTWYRDSEIMGLSLYRMKRTLLLIYAFPVEIPILHESFKAPHSIMSVAYGREAAGVSKFTEQGSSLHIN